MHKKKFSPDIFKSLISAIRFAPKYPTEATAARTSSYALSLSIFLNAMPSSSGSKALALVTGLDCGAVKGEKLKLRKTLKNR